MSRRTNAAVSLKLDSSPKPESKTGQQKRGFNPTRLLTSPNLFSFLLGFILSSFVWMSMWSTQVTEETSKLEVEQQKKLHRAAIVVPFRDRFDELENFVPHISQYLTRKSIPHDVKTFYLTAFSPLRHLK